MENIFEVIPDDNTDHPLTGAEVEIILESFITNRGPVGYTEDEAVSVVRWAEAARVNLALLNLVLEGVIDIGWKTDTNEPTFRANERGKFLISEIEKDATPNGLN